LAFIIQQTKDVDFEAFSSNELLKDSCCFRLIQISENAKKISPDSDIQKQLPMKQLVGLRNRIVHDYGTIDFGILYQTVTQDIPQVYALVEAILKQ
jgi:uncharacterized protein with HEPN domain